MPPKKIVTKKHAVKKSPKKATRSKKNIVASVKKHDSSSKVDLSLTKLFYTSNKELNQTDVENAVRLQPKEFYFVLSKNYQELFSDKNKKWNFYTLGMMLDCVKEQNKKSPLVKIITNFIQEKFPDKLRNIGKAKFLDIMDIETAFKEKSRKVSITTVQYMIEKTPSAFLYYFEENYNDLCVDDSIEWTDKTLDLLVDAVTSYGSSDELVDQVVYFVKLKKPNDPISTLFRQIKEFPRSKKCWGDWKKIFRLLTYIRSETDVKFCIPNVLVPSLSGNQNDNIGIVWLKINTDEEIVLMQTTVNLKRAIHYCKEKFVVLSLKLHAPGENIYHSNMLFIDKSRKTFERFEPNGAFYNKIDVLVNNFLQNDFKTKYLSDSYSYISPLDVCPNIGPQMIQGQSKKCKDGGYCVVFSTMYAHIGFF